MPDPFAASTASLRGALPAPHRQALLHMVHALPLPAMLQGDDFKLIDTNEAYAALVGRRVRALIGRDPIELEPAEDREGSLAERQDIVAAAQVALPGTPLQAMQRRLVDAQGQERWFSASLTQLAPAGGPALWLTLWHEVSGEVAARGQARRAQHELAQWFELSGTGMVVYDGSGLIVRCNAAFEALIDDVPETLAQASPELQALLGWMHGAMLPALAPGAPAIDTQALVPMRGGRRRRLSARLACDTVERVERADGGVADSTDAKDARDVQDARESRSASDSRRVMAVVQDRSAEDDRDLAQLEMGMLMDTASIGVATYDPGRGWLAPPDPPERAGPGFGTAPKQTPGGALQNISRELVEPGSLPEFERLQRALRNGERTEVRYAVRHAEMGLRWLLTRVEPGALAGGRNTTSVVTLDVTDQERAQRRNAQLLRELTTILDSSTAGIAYLRGPVLVRCNRRFERMLGFDAGAAAGASLEEILARSIGASGAVAANVPQQGAAAALQALARGEAFETELPLLRADGTPQWYSLSVRRALDENRPDSAGVHDESVAVLTDITRLKNQQAELEQLLRDRELMFSLSEVGIVYQRGSRIERANQAMAALTGWASPELMTLDAAELYEDTRACVAFEARIAQALHARGRFNGERRLRRRDGSLVWVQVAVRPVDGQHAEAGDTASGADSLGAAVTTPDALSVNGSADGPANAAANGAANGPANGPANGLASGSTSEPGAAAAGGLICSFIDIDERRRTRETLALQAERTRAILNSVLVGIVTVSEQGIQWMNRSARRMFGGELADFVGEPLSIVATPEPEHPLRRPEFLYRLKEGQSETFECRLKGRDGREFWVVGNAVLTSASASSSGSGAGTPVREVTVALLDIERRRQAEVSIGKAQASLQRLIETAPLVIALFDARTLRVQQANHAASSFFGSPLSDVLGATLDACCAPPKAAALRVWFAQAMAAGAATQHEWHDEIVSASNAPAGARVWDCRIAALDEDGDGTRQMLLVASDVTEQRNAERARLQAAITQREVLVREVHHRIKNNLQGVAGLLRQNAARRPELAAMLSEAEGQVLAIAQVYGLQVGASGPLQAAGLLRAIAGSVQRTFGRSIVVDVQGHVPHLLPEAEAIPIALTINELMTNAVKHGVSTGTGAGMAPGTAIGTAIGMATGTAIGTGSNAQGDVRCTLQAAGDAGEAICIRVANAGTLAAGVDVTQVRGGVSGLGLVRALLPRRSATLSLQQEGPDVVAQVELRPPSVRQPDAAEAASQPFATAAPALLATSSATPQSPAPTQATPSSTPSSAGLGTPSSPASGTPQSGA